MKKVLPVLLAVVLAATALPAAAVSQAPSNADPPIISWQPPSSWSMAPAGGLTKYAEIGHGPAPFYPITPCRQYDSRSTTALANNTPRTVLLSGAPCGIPPFTNAIAVNITIFSITGAGSNGVFKVDTVSPPVTAWINYPPTETQRGNAGVVSTDGLGRIVVQVNQGAGSVHFTVDVFGYYYNGNFEKMPANDYFGIWGSYSGYGVLFARNDEASAVDSHGVEGWTFSTGAGSAGVSGEALGGTGAVYGVKGRIAASSGAGSAGVYGIGAATTGATYGVLGESGTTAYNSAGVRGIDGGGPPTGLTLYSSGVLGETNNNPGYGVIGLSKYIAVFGILLDVNGAGTQSRGMLGTTLSGGPWGVYAFGNIGASGTKPFVEVHPTDANKLIRYVALEGPEAGTYFRGRARFTGGVAVIPVPESFRLVSAEEGLTVQITAIGEMANFAVERADLNEVVVKGSKDIEFYYLVNGIRETFKDWPVIVEDGYMPDGPNAHLPEYFSLAQRQRLISNGTYNADGTVNMRTAERLGWAQKWREGERPQQQAVSRTAPEPGNAPRQ